MKKNTLFILLATLFLQSECYSQCAQALSKAGNAHNKAAEVLMGMASSVDDYEQVAIEYEKVLENDPNHAPTCMKLGRLYVKIGNEKGNTAFDKAEYYFNRCKEICVDSSDVADVEIAILNALRRKFANGPNRFVGTWGIIQYDGIFRPEVEISYNGTGYSFNVVDKYYINASNFTIESESATEIIFTYTCVYDHRDELRQRGWTKYYDDCDVNADPGYPQAGRYYYNVTNGKYRMSYAIEREKVLLKYLMVHTDYFLNGEKTYADTENNWSPACELIKHE